LLSILIISFAFSMHLAFFKENNNLSSDFGLLKATITITGE